MFMQWWDAMLCVACTSIGQIILSYPYQMASTGIIAGFGGGRVLGIIAKIFIVISVLGTGIVQIVASSSSQYAVNKTYNKRTWSFIFGPIISMFAFLPTARSNRLLNIIGLAGTNYSCLYFFVNACSKGIDHSKILLRPPSTQRFFTGAAVMASGTGSFSAVMEITDSLRQSRKMDYAILLAVFWIMLLVIPHTTAVVLAYPHQALTKAGVIFLLALAIPFYGVLNSLASGLTDPSLAFILPCLAFSIFYWKKENRDHCPKFIPSFLKQRDWAPMFAINLVIMIVFAGTFTSLSIVLFMSWQPPCPTGGREG
ncbi:g3440 [Coccomyxa elongata]